MAENHCGALSGASLLFFSLILVSACDSPPRAPVAGNYDARLERSGPPMPPLQAQRSALEAFQSQAQEELVAEFDTETGVTRTLHSRLGYLTNPSSASAFDVAVDFLASHLDLLGLEAKDIEDFEVTDIVPSRLSGATHFYLRQRHQAIPVYNGQLHINVNRAGQIISVNNVFFPKLAASVNSVIPAIDASQAVIAAADHLGLVVREAPRVLSKTTSKQQLSHLTAPGISAGEIVAQLMWLPVPPEARLVWNFQIAPPAGWHVFDLTVDAGTGKVWTRINWTHDAVYRVYERPIESPNDVVPQPPADARTLARNPENAVASPYGWHDLNGVPGPDTLQLQGNNAAAGVGRFFPGWPLPPIPPSIPECSWTTGPEQQRDPLCDFPLRSFAQPFDSAEALAANAFYWVNLMHDVQYQYGFDEASGNFQQNNYGRGGKEGDRMSIYANLDPSIIGPFIAICPDGVPEPSCPFGSGFGGNAIFLLPRPSLPPSQQRAAALDANVIVHEYAHGVSHRLVGGKSNVRCLNNLQTPDEGLSDWFALVYTARAADRPGDARGMGTYYSGQPPNGAGIRRKPYSTDPAINDYTYENVADAGGLRHDVGEIWAQATWEMYWALVGKHGFSANLHHATGGYGNQRALLYVTEGLKYAPCEPSFTDMRDAILKTAEEHHGGEDACLLWGAFAAFGLGVDAQSGGANGRNPINGFSIPRTCKSKDDT